ncbi:family 16 glycosylhydrolase [Chitinophaga sp. 212800010-3]|uniref:family 16 glycosylhydrolase n=1 Tax=unclassified Chitinophaga TaxID=2619133 RepID=UPI002DEAB8B1|nr:GH16 domain-containing protein [Chitinophaga sp. 212800010-3]
MKRLFYLLFLISSDLWAQEIPAPTDLQLTGTRSWVKAGWKDNAENETGYNVYWSVNGHKPATPSATLPANTNHYYIQQVAANKNYHVWIEAVAGNRRSKALTGTVTATTQWTLDTTAASHLDIASSAAVPEGMQLFWHDEFNDELLDRNKWHTVYYSNIDFLKKDNFQEMRNGTLPEAAYSFTGHSINIFTNDSLPAKAYYPANGRKISSIQTYDWGTNDNLLDNSRGGYFEVRVRRSYTGHPAGLNTAFWFDSPGPDLKYYLQEGTTLEGTAGIRPKGQVFEIDVFENLDAQFVMHGHVDKNGRFIHNLATHIAEGFTHRDNWVVHGILWTPNSIKHYINGQLIKAYTDPHQVYSPNHFMNVFLGSYGGGGSVNMEVDYIRGYQWLLEGGNELPNPGFEANNNLLPWEGTGTLSAGVKRNGQHALLLKPGQEITQYVYLNNDAAYQLSYWAQGSSELYATVNNVKLVTGELQQAAEQHKTGKSTFTENKFFFKTGKEYGNNTKTVKISFTNRGSADIILDDVDVRKAGK